VTTQHAGDPRPAAQPLRYAAFISYRHAEADRLWARWLHSALETYHTPRALIRQGVPARMGRVFRDEEEVPAASSLSAEIESALSQSRFLIVVCSPRTPESAWVDREIRRFRELGRGDNVLALLIEGEPRRSFPPALREIRRKLVDASGAEVEQVLAHDPLAADVRLGRGESRAQRRRFARLSLAALLLGCRFDDLRRRDHERRLRSLRWVAAALGAIVLALGTLAAIALEARSDAEIQAARARNERDAKAAALEDVLRLSDVKRARDLVEQADELWPLQPQRAEAMAEWVVAAHELLRKREDHRARLERLRSHARPYDDLDRTRDRAAIAEQLEQVRQRTKDLEEQRATLLAGALPAPDLLADLDEELGRLRAALQAGEKSLETRQTWRFGSPEAAWQHQVLVDLLAALDVLGAGEPAEGLISQVSKRRALSVDVYRRSIEEHAESWRRAQSGIQGSGRYAGLRIDPQVGLVPLGPDPTTGLFEFAHVGSGSILQRDPATGGLGHEDDAAIVFVLIPGGTYWMGAQREAPKGRNHDVLADNGEAPVHAVTISPFFLAKHECTQGQWAALTSGANPSKFRSGQNWGERQLTPRNPVEQVRWTDMTMWLARHGLCLPTEAQWEYAARAGTSTPWANAPDVPALSRFANIADDYMKAHGGEEMDATAGVNDGQSVHAPVRTFQPNAFGLYDVLGNVFEFCRDRYGGYGSEPAVDPVLEGPGYKVARGGTWSSVASEARVSTRQGWGPTMLLGGLGFRPARALDGATSSGAQGR
jgi:formylglycine-generating enzyme required for sulfatase activity